MNKYALILAGGRGKRLWPISTVENPKQFLNLYGNEIMINETIRRIESLYNYRDIFIIINESQKDLAYRYIDGKIPKENIIIEPKSKNTAMGIFYASIKIKKMRGDGVISILSSDHYIKNENELVKNLKQGIKIAEEKNSLVILGINPTYAATGFGYIKCFKDKEYNCYKVKEFKQKPNAEKAKEFIKSGQYVWNSGMYIWNINTILDSFKQFLPQIYKFEKELYKSILTDSEEKITNQVYENIEEISIDKGILEKSKNINMIKGSFEWMDIGSIKDFFEIHPKDSNANTVIGNAILKETNESNIFSDNNEVIITVGVQNLSIIRSNGICLICDKERTKEIPQLLGI